MTSVMDRRAFIGTLAGGLLAAPLAAGAQQQPKTPKIGLLTPAIQADSSHLVEALRQGLRQLGHVEGTTFVLEHRLGEGKPERFPQLARELVDRKVNVIVVSTDVAIVAV